MGFTSKISNYYKNVIEYSDLAEVSIAADLTGDYPRGGYTVTQKALSSGMIDKTTVSKLFAGSKENVMDITIAFDAFKHGKKYKAAMWATASLKRDGNLIFPEFPSYTISKSYLPPFEKNISVGSTWEDFVEIQNNHRFDEMNEWHDFIVGMSTIKKQIIKEIKIESKGGKPKTPDTSHYLFKGNLIAKMNTNILSIYKEALKSKNVHSLLSNNVAKFCSKENKHKKKPEITLTPKLSGGLPKSKFIPNFEQWLSIETVLKAKHGELTAVQGPPGTGKTSLLQFVIASEVVNAVCENLHYPTLTAICSMNNQAVTNAIESLALDSSDRWIPTDVGLGMYLPSPDKAKDANIPNITINKSSYDKVYVNSDYLEPFLQYETFSVIKDQFLITARKKLNLKENSTIQDILKDLKIKVLKSNKQLQTASFKTKVKTALKRGTSYFFKDNSSEYYQAKKSEWNASLPRMKDSFKYSLHYWEARFIEEIDVLFEKQGNKRKLAFKSPVDAIQTISLFTPFIGMTLHQLAKNFGNASNPQVATESIGLLIVDESGQVCPETGFFSLYLAQKALVVGDSMQLEPIHSISENEDARLMKENKLQDTFKSSKGNFMSLADSAAQYSTCLLEHYRCHPEIISISNELCYENKLIPRTSEEHGLYPPLSFLDVYGICQKDPSGSLKNKDESDCIISWATEQRSKIEEYYKQDIKDVLAIVTPFKKHADNIQTGLERAGIKNVIVGTVHKLQGAEFPIVIFAPTYTIEYVRSMLESKGQSMFFDASPSMINVAASRAQKSFIYMGDPRILNYGNEYENLPSQTLSKHLKKNGVALEHSSNAYKFADLHADIERISSLDSHRDSLKRAFEDAQDRLVISSPFITKSALQKDSIEEQIRNAVKRGVKVKVFYDSQLNSVRRHELKDSINRLKEAGAEVVHKDRLHSKVLYIDNKMIIESSFNWLSAVRDESSEYQRYESSLLYRGDLAAKMIAEVEKEFSTSSTS